jgi:hypothetical protein
MVARARAMCSHTEVVAIQLNAQLAPQGLRTDIADMAIMQRRHGGVKGWRSATLCDIRIPVGDGGKNMIENTLKVQPQ